MKTIPVTEARQNIYKLIEDTISSSEPVQITYKKGNVVVISEQDWRAIQETLYLLSVPGLRESIQDAENTPIEEMKTLEDLGWDLD
ncbi:MAG: type II toxin-antitoxin system Phd/YefM family antitoxin [Desulfitobacteriaceae bacterium]|nr:type II toxin-antitoxin system Phd/YefM family antitoxin [Desulfitobacteriaceae bacterium]MDI6915709.1 type II toxin-antitoxin system Phd/YefM family antitoxin [Desulfitobacteriaceae bacterium]